MPLFVGCFTDESPLGRISHMRPAAEVQSTKSTSVQNSYFNVIFCCISSAITGLSYSTTIRALRCQSPGCGFEPNQLTCVFCASISVECCDRIDFVPGASATLTPKTLCRVDEDYFFLNTWTLSEIWDRFAVIRGILIQLWVTYFAIFIHLFPNLVVLLNADWVKICVYHNLVTVCGFNRGGPLSLSLSVSHIMYAASSTNSRL